MEYSCICCGTCCQKYQPWLNLEEVKHLAGELGLTSQQFISDYTDRRWPGTESFLLIHKDDACIFMQTTPDTHLCLCRIHAFKPTSCRAWAAGTHKSECQAGLKHLLGISVDTSNHLIATPEQLERLADRMKLIREL